MARAFTGMLRDGTFPDNLKRGVMVLIPKGTASYRPLCLLETLGKLYEQVVLQRLRRQLEEGQNLSERQFGFRRGRSTFSALKALGNIVSEVGSVSYTNRKACVMVTLDIENAFNSAPWCTLMEQLRDKTVPDYIIGAVAAYLRGRSIVVGTGSVLGPTLWNILYDPVLGLKVPEGVTLLGYADDLALVGVGKDRGQLEDRVNEALRKVTQWMGEVGLRLAEHKTKAVVLVGSRRTRGIQFAVGDFAVEPKDAVKYLGVWHGREYRFGFHVSRTLEKAEVTIKNLARLMPRVGGPGERRRTLLCSVATAQILYAAPIWENALRHRKYREAIGAAGRRMALRVASAYRTVSGPAIMVVASMPPLHLLAAEREATGTSAEAREDTERRWQEEWSMETRGAWTRRIMPDLRPWMRRRHGEVDHWLCQMLTGHGAFGAYLHKFKRRETPACMDCGGYDDVHHTFFECPRWEETRSHTWRHMGVEPTAEQFVGVMLEGPDRWKAIAIMAKKILTTKDREDTARTRPR